MRGRTSSESWDLQFEWGRQPGWPLYTPPPPGPALPVPRRSRDACKLQITGQGTPKLVGVSYGPEGPEQRAGRVLGGLPAAPGSLWVQMGMLGGLGAAFCPPCLRQHTTPVPTFRATVGRSPRGAGGVWVPGTGAQPELTPTLPTFC